MTNVGSPETQPTNPLFVVPQFSVTLFVSSLASVVLVIVVGLLIAFMQYQSRLMRLMPNFTVGQLVYFIEIEAAIEDNNRQLAKLAEKVAKEEADQRFASNEIEFRIGRICNLFDKPSDNNSAGYFKTCSEFLKKIPFEGTPAPTPPSSTLWSWLGLQTESKPPVEQIQPGALQGIQKKFVEVMKDAKIGDTQFSQMIDIYTTDLKIIADKNQTFRLFTMPTYEAADRRYQALCELKRTLIAIVQAYHEYDLGDCGNRYTTVFALDAVGSPGLPGSPPPKPEISSVTPPASPPPKPDPSSVGSPPPKPEASSVTPPASPPKPDPSNIVPNPPPPPITTVPAAPKQTGRATTLRDLGRSPSTALPGAPAGGDDTAMRQRLFELVNNYMFYDKLSGQHLRGLLLSPADFLALLLVGFCGIMGALLRIVFYTYESGKDPSFRSFIVGPILGLICALVVYILFRAGFIAITDQSQTSSETSSLSPFVIAIVAMAAGLLSERSIELFRKTGGTWLGSVEASQAARWAVRLKREIDRQGLTYEKLAESLDVSAPKLQDWAEERDMVPMDKQREIALVLKVQIRDIFTDLPPRPLT